MIDKLTFVIQLLSTVLIRNSNQIEIFAFKEWDENDFLISLETRKERRSNRVQTKQNETQYNKIQKWNIIETIHMQMFDLLT